jgi:5-methylcytosine-specific restriction protein B
VLVIDEINRGDLSRVLGEAIFLFESGEEDRMVELPHECNGSRKLRLEPGLRVLATLNTADRSIARLDIAIRRRFAFLDMWPDLAVVNTEGVQLGIDSFEDTLDTFTEHADDAGLNLVPGHAYFLDPRPDLDRAQRGQRVRRRLEHELLPLLAAYVDERLLGPATSEVQGLFDRIAGKLRTTAHQDADS